MSLLIEQLVAENEGQIAQDNTKIASVMQTVEFAQALNFMGEDFYKVAQEIGDPLFETIGIDLYNMGEKMTGGLSKLASDSSAVEDEYAELACELHKYANYLNDLAHNDNDETILKYAEHIAFMCDSITEEVGVEKVASYIDSLVERGAIIHEKTDSLAPKKNLIRQILNKTKEKGGRLLEFSKHHGGRGLSAVRANKLLAAGITAGALATAGGGYALARRKRNS